MAWDENVDSESQPPVVLPYKSGNGKGNAGNARTLGTDHGHQKRMAGEDAFTVEPNGWLWHERLVEQKVGLQKAFNCYHKTCGESAELRRIWINLQNIECLQRAMAQCQGLVEARREAGMKLLLLDHDEAKLVEEIGMRIANLQKVAGTILDSHQIALGIDSSRQRQGVNVEQISEDLEMGTVRPMPGESWQQPGHRQQLAGGFQDGGTGESYFSTDMGKRPKCTRRMGWNGDGVVNFSIKRCTVVVTRVATAHGARRSTVIPTIIEGGRECVVV